MDIKVSTGAGMDSRTALSPKEGIAV